MTPPGVTCRLVCWCYIMMHCESTGALPLATSSDLLCLCVAALGDWSKMLFSGNSLWSNVGFGISLPGLHSVPGEGTKVPQAVQHRPKNVLSSYPRIRKILPTLSSKCEVSHGCIPQPSCPGSTLVRSCVSHGDSSLPGLLGRAMESLCALLGRTLPGSWEVPSVDVVNC